jgi:hypothetical protein
MDPYPLFKLFERQIIAQTDNPVATEEKRKTDEKHNMRLFCHMSPLLRGADTGIKPHAPEPIEYQISHRQSMGEDGFGRANAFKDLELLVALSFRAKREILLT